MCFETIIIAGSIALHTSTKYEPDEGYKVFTDSLGVSIEECVDKGFKQSLTAFRFGDSYGKTSVAAFYSVKYQNSVVTPAFGVGHIGTSYYNGFLPLPYLEKDINERVKVQAMYIPEMQRNDGVFALQLGWRF